MITTRQLMILQHTLGVDEYGEGPHFRNHLCAGEDDETVCVELVALGLMQRFPDRKMIPYPTYGVTAAGKIVVRDESPKAPRLSRSQKRYRAFLESDLNISFFEHMKLVGSRSRGEAGSRLEDYLD